MGRKLEGSDKADALRLAMSGISLALACLAPFAGDRGIGKLTALEDVEKDAHCYHHDSSR